MTRFEANLSILCSIIVVEILSPVILRESRIFWRERRVAINQLHLSSRRCWLRWKVARSYLESYLSVILFTQWEVRKFCFRYLQHLWTKLARQVMAARAPSSLSGPALMDRKKCWATFHTEATLCAALHLDPRQQSTARQNPKKPQTIQTLTLLRRQKPVWRREITAQITSVHPDRFLSTKSLVDETAQSGSFPTWKVQADNPRISYSNLLLLLFSLQAAIGWNSSEWQVVQFQCGGALISNRLEIIKSVWREWHFFRTNRFVLTAAHCVNRKPLPTFVRLGRVIEQNC